MTASTTVIDVHDHRHLEPRLHIELPQPQTPLQPLELARRAILAPSGLDEDRIARVLGNVMGHSVDYADLYFQLVREESWSLEDSIVKDGTSQHRAGRRRARARGREDRLRVFRRDRAAGADRSVAGGARDRAQRRDELDAGVACIDRPSAVSAARSARRA